MKKRKGAGYFIEGIVAILVLLIFVAGSYASLSQERSWVEFEREVAAGDLTYTLKQTGHLDRFVERGETGAVRGVSSSLTSYDTSISGTVSGIPTGTHLVGVYTDRDGTDTVTDESLTDVDSDDRCYGDLSEIRPDEGNVVRTSSSGPIEQLHGIRLYFADADPGRTGTDQLDYDSVWVDNKTNCQFTRSEGPYRLNDFISLNDNAYNFYSIDSDGSSGQVVLQNSEVSYELKRDFSELESATVNVRRFNFSNDLSQYDVLVFKDRDNLGDVNSFESELLSYMENGKVIFAMSLSQNDFDSGFLSRTGMRWMDLPLNSGSGEEMFGTGERGQDAENYYTQLGFTPEDVSIDPEGKIASGNERYTRDTQILATAEQVYDRSSWNSYTSSLSPTGSAPAGVPESDCSDPYRAGSMSFTEGTSGSEDLEVYNVKLSGDGCSSFQYGVGIDKTGNDGDPDGDMDERGEGIILNEGLVTVNQRIYQVEIMAHDEVRFNYVGDQRPEIFSHVHDLETRSSEGFGRFPSVDGSSSQAEFGLLSSVVFTMLDHENSFGPEEASTVSTTAAGRTEDGDVFKLNLRWIE